MRCAELAHVLHTQQQLAPHLGLNLVHTCPRLIPQRELGVSVNSWWRGSGLVADAARFASSQ